MKGIVFTEFLDMVESEFGYDVVDKILESSELESEGVYTAVGTYHHSEIVALLMNLSKEVKMDPGILLKEFGKYLFNTFLSSYPQFFDEADGAFPFLESIDTHIHVEVKKLYPKATLPKFETSVNDEGQMIMIYQSERKMAALADGLIEKALAYYEEDCSVTYENMNEDGSEVKFIITKNG